MIRATRPELKIELQAPWWSERTLGSRRCSRIGGTSKISRPGSREVRRIFETAPMRDLVVSESLPGPGVQTDDEWQAILRMVSFGASHPLGTCKMGTDDETVVDPVLRVRGVKGLRVVDASVMPEEPSGNTNAPPIMVAEKASDLIRQP
jgi:choline dehydrogenase